MSKITYILGDATNPIGEGMKIIPHVCNDIRVWGAGFVLALSKKWSYPEFIYRNKMEMTLGTVTFVSVEDDILVANMVGQHGVGVVNNIIPLRYDELKNCLIQLNDLAVNLNATIHMPRIGSGLAGGKWSEIEKLIEENVHVPVTVYDLKPVIYTQYKLD